MYLKALEINGFKSFPDKTRISFNDNITAIVGPNGSGKSNIADAILWVMGEQRTKNLRGNKMEDVIFGGTEKRPKLGYAQVSLILDNSARIFNSENSEIVLSRKYYRNGDSEYYINKESVRLKDIVSILMDTGLGRDGYSIIGQGKISEIISTKSSERREVFEEAAGISRYRYRKEEAEKKLERTEANLQRVNDKIEELELQVGPLKSQSEKAKQYLEIKNKLKVCEVTSSLNALDKIKSRTKDIETQIEQTGNELSRTKKELDSLYASADNVSEYMQEKDLEIEKTRMRLSIKEREASDYKAASAVLENELVNIDNNIERLLSNLEERESRIKEIDEQISEYDKTVQSESEELKELNQQKTKNDNIIDGCKIKVDRRERIVSQYSEQQTTLSIEYKTAESRFKLLSDLEKEYEGYTKAVKAVMKEAARGNLKGVFGPVSQLLTTSSEYSVAIEVALGAAAQNIVVDSQDSGKKAIEMLKKNDSGRATFLPVDIINGKTMPEPDINDEGYIGIAANLVQYEKSFQGIVYNLLGRTIVAETLSSALRISKKLNYSNKIVTLDGQQVNAGGSLTGGSLSKTSGFLSRANELKKLREDIDVLSIKLRSAENELENAKQSLASVTSQMYAFVEENNELQSKILALKSEINTTANARKQLYDLRIKLSDGGKGIIRETEVLRKKREEKELEKAESEKKQSQIQDDISVINKEITKISESRIQLEGKRNKFSKQAQSINNEMLELERQAARLEQKKLSDSLEEKQIYDRLWENYELSYSAACSIRDMAIPASSLARDMAQYRRQLAELGTPNIGAIEEYERVNERYEFLSSQRRDVTKSKTEIISIINEITQEMTSIFISKFDEINVCFKTVFLELFGGGKAELILEDRNDALNCGIEIKVQPPGKNLSAISLLSGGEMAFVAIALYFAILKIRPTPFCVMDEIEAALDESNVSKFADYLRTMSDKTQFLVITHRRGTMEKADFLYGVTMQEKGVSSVIQLDLDNIDKTITGVRK